MTNTLKLVISTYSFVIFCPINIKENETHNRHQNKWQPKQDTFLTVAVIPVLEEPLTIGGLHLEMLAWLEDTGTEVRIINYHLC